MARDALSSVEVRHPQPALLLARSLACRPRQYCLAGRQQKKRRSVDRRKLGKNNEISLYACLRNTIRPSATSTTMVSLAANLPERISFASGFSISAWIARFSGRAP